jgi:hypothetical protein
MQGRPRYLPQLRTPGLLASRQPQVATASIRKRTAQRAGGRGGHVRQKEQHSEGRTYPLFTQHLPAGRAAGTQEKKWRTREY